MSRENLIQKMLDTVSKLPQHRAAEVADFADYLLFKYDEEMLEKGMEKLVSDGKAFEFLKDEDDLYSLKDLKEKYK